MLRGLGYMPLTKAMLDIYCEVIGSPIPRDLDYDEFFDFVWRFRLGERGKAKRFGLDPAFK